MSQGIIISGHPKAASRKHTGKHRICQAAGAQPALASPCQLYYAASRVSSGLSIDMWSLQRPRVACASNSRCRSLPLRATYCRASSGPSGSPRSPRSPLPAAAGSGERGERGEPLGPEEALQYVARNGRDLHREFEAQATRGRWRLHMSMLNPLETRLAA